MLNIPSLQQKTASDTNALSDNDKNKKTMGRLRIMRDFADLNALPSTCEVIQPDLSDISQFTIIISPDDGFYKNGRFIFSIDIPSDYPNKPPKVKCTQTIYHPNINLEGNVCLNILRDDWRPMLTIETVILGLIFLFLEPNADDPLNHDAAAILKKDRNIFKTYVDRTMAGGTLNNIQYNNVLE
ncbi:unnamed protein product [Adineta steineri]|uniref:UBC core domain-containing protein n=1 Tax=Adineta steineri TaxID=433720 RepID=A0A813Q1Y1_9BILA|nr:unnamed protein product [Adineta steineri]CAF3575015.1 unnamed protein product [Adineta steineri]